MKSIKEMTNAELAAFVASLNKIDLKEIERWSKVEGRLEKFNSIKGRFTGEET